MNKTFLESKWLDPQCYDKGTCQSLVFKAKLAEVTAERDALVRQNLALCDAMGYSDRDHEMDSPEEHAARMRADAERYRWLRLRLQTRNMAAVTGGRRLAIETIIGRAFFDSPIKPRKLDEETAKELDAAIDTAIGNKLK